MAYAFFFLLLVQPEFKLSSFHITAFKNFVRSIEVRELPSAPKWYPPGRCIFKFAQISDVHLNGNSQFYLKRALLFLNRQIKPAFVIFSGDNSGGSQLRAHKAFLSLLKKNLQSEYFVLPGDNWHKNFCKVFPATAWIFSCQGIYFLGCSLDRDGGEGIGVFEESTFRSIREQLSKRRNSPFVYVQHEPAYPPTFLDAPKLRALFEATGNVVLALSGHLHVDLIARESSTTYITAPGLGPNPRHGFKVVEVYEGCLVARTAAWVHGGYKLLRIFQKIPLPKGMRIQSKGPVVPKGFKALGCRDRILDTSLRHRFPELATGISLFALKEGYVRQLAEAFIASGRKKSKEERGEKGKKKTEAGIQVRP